MRALIIAALAAATLVVSATPVEAQSPYRWTWSSYDGGYGRYGDYGGYGGGYGYHPYHRGPQAPLAALAGGTAAWLGGGTPAILVSAAAGWLLGDIAEGLAARRPQEICTWSYDDQGRNFWVCEGVAVRTHKGPPGMTLPAASAPAEVELAAPPPPTPAAPAATPPAANQPAPAAQPPAPQPQPDPCMELARTDYRRFVYECVMRSGRGS